MRTLLLTLMILFAPMTAHAAVDSEVISEALSKAVTTQVKEVHEVAQAIGVILEQDPLNRNRRMDVQEIYDLAIAVEKAHIATGVDWKLLLSISYVESNLCHSRWLKGDQKEGTTGKRLFDYWSVGCMQVNLKYWGIAVRDAGLQQADLLDHEKGIIIGALILKHKVDTYGWKLGIKRYNGAGPKADEYRSNVLTVYNVLNT